MPDPFESLREPETPVEPDPAFAAGLRARVERALALPRGVIVSETTLPAGRPEKASAPGDPAGAATGVTAYLIVDEARQALDWYVEVFGARRRGAPVVMADGRVGHAELDLGADTIYVADVSPDSDVAAPRVEAGATVTLVVETTDVDETFGRATHAGATVERSPTDHPHGRNAVVRDPFGHRWMISAAAEEMRPGDIGYVSLWVPDVERAEAFFGAVLGWSFTPGSGEPGRQVTGVAPHHGLWGGHDPSTLFLCYVVDDVDEATERVRAAGGTAEAPTEEPYGHIANCRDDQGTPFAVFRPPPGARAPRLAPNGSRPGDLAYITLEGGDSSRTRAFYGSVLGWRYRAGQVDDGWQVDEARPMTGLHGGRSAATGVPLYRVDDIGAAVDRVRAAGGTATGPERRPYGLVADCTDDQGTHFSLGELD